MSTPSGSKTVILAIDQGTHASRALLFDHEGSVRFTHSRKIDLNRRDTKRIEQDPEEIIVSLNEVIRQARQYAASHRLFIHSAGLSTQRSTTVAWDKTSGKALYPALSWQDTRSWYYLAELKDKADEVKTLTGLRLSAHYSACKLRWLLENVPEVAATADSDRLCLGTLSSFILYRLIENHPFLVDHGNASRTLLCNINTCRWEPRLLQYFGISSEHLPSQRPIRSDYGRIKGSDICLSAVNGDQPSALLGQSPTGNPESITINIGSGAFIMYDTGTRHVYHPRLLTAISDSDHRSCRYCLEGTVNGAGTALQWAEKTWGLDLSKNWQIQLNQELPLFINTIGGLGSPWWQSNLSTRLLGLKPQNCRRDSVPCLAAILESIAFMVFANIEQIVGAGITIRNLRVAGGVSRYRYLCQALADLSGLSVHRSRETEITARGVAWLASGNSRPFPSPLDEIIAPRPNPALGKRYRRYLRLIS